MAEHFLQSLDDSRLDPYRQLKKSNLTRWSGKFIAEGIRVVQRLLASEFGVESVLVSEAQRRRLPADLGREHEVYTLPQPLAELIVGYRFHAGVLACGRRPASVDFGEWVPASPHPALLVGCPNTTDPDNLGTIIRVAAAFGADGLLVGEKSADPFSRRTIRVSMGNVFTLPIHESADLVSELEALQEIHGFEVVASVLSPEAVPISQAIRANRMILLLGNESEGLPESVVRFARQKVTIPMATGVDSLNVGIAAGIMLHHFRGAGQTDLTWTAAGVRGAGRH